MSNTTTPALPLTGESTGPDWTHARRLVASIKHGFRVAIASQILAGQEILSHKIALNFNGRGGDRSKPQAAVLLSLNRTWSQWCDMELGISADTADRLIQTFEAAKDRLRRLGGHERALSLLTTSPDQLDDEGRKTLCALVDKLEWPESQAELLREFKEISKIHNATTGGDTSAHRKPKPAAAQQLAFAFFRPVEQTVNKLQRAVENLRLAPDYKRLLHVLPLVSSEPGEPSLTSLAAEIQSALEGDLSKALADIREVMELRTKQQPATA